MSACRAACRDAATAIRLARAIVTIGLLGASVSGAAGQQGGAANAPGVSVSDSASTAADSAELLFWETIKDSTNPAEYRAYLEQYPDGVFAALARIRAEPAGVSSSTGSQVGAGVETPLSEAAAPAESEAPSTEENAEAAPIYAVGDRVEALSAQGWAAATIVEQDARGVRVNYDDEALPDEQLDARLLRPAESRDGEAGEAEPGEAPPAGATGSEGGGAVADAPAGQVAPGAYGCRVEFSAFANGAAAVSAGAAEYDITILPEGRYQAFSGEDGLFAYDPAGQVVSWDTGSLSGVETRYEEDSTGSRLILTQFPAPGTSTCTRK